jgi:microcystin-dependent protein
MTVPYVGAISLFAGTYDIKGWSYCDGKILKIENFPELYEVIGNKYGGDATTQQDFALPNLQEAEKGLNGVRYQIAVIENIFAPDPLTSYIFLSVFDTPPNGYTFYDGALLRIQQYQALYSIIGTTYGGNGTTTFALPNLTEAEKGLNGARYVICINGIYPTRN